MRLDVVDEPFLITAHTEEVVRFDDFIGRPMAVRTEIAVHEVLVRKEALAGNAVVPLIFRLVDEITVVEILKDLADDLFVTLLGRADEVIVFDAEFFPELLKTDHGGVALFDRGHIVFRGGFLDFLSVFVGSGQEPDVLTHRAMVPGDNISENRGVSVADVRLVVHIINRRSQIKRRHNSSFLLKIMSIKYNTT